MNCDEFRAAVLTGEMSEATRHHGETCAACRSRIDRLSLAHERLADPAVWEEPSPELAFQVEELITSAGRGGADHGIAKRRWTRLAVAVVVAILVAGAITVTANRSDDPDWEVALPATELASGATATVRGWNETAGTRMVVSITGLSPAPPGYVYEFWLSEGPVHISAGTFHSQGDIQLWSGVKRADFPRLWVTLEPIDDDESPSGQTVLDTGDV